MHVRTEVTELIAHTDAGYTFRVSKNTKTGKWGVLRWKTNGPAIPPVMDLLTAQGWVGVIKASNEFIDGKRFDTDEAAMIAAFGGL